MKVNYRIEERRKGVRSGPSGEGKGVDMNEEGIIRRRGSKLYD